jgi:hypothetical protein
MKMLADFTPDQLKFIGMLVVTFGGTAVTVLWKVASWVKEIEMKVKTHEEWSKRQDQDLDNFGKILKTDTALNHNGKQGVQSGKG